MNPTLGYIIIGFCISALVYIVYDIVKTFKEGKEEL